MRTLNSNQHILLVNGPIIVVYNDSMIYHSFVCDLRGFHPYAINDSLFQISLDVSIVVLVTITQSNWLLTVFIK